MKKMLSLILSGTLLLGGLMGFISPTEASAASTANSASISSKSVQLIKTGIRYLGVPYRLGAEYETSRRFDCSSFTQYVFKKNGKRIARGARAQYYNGVPVARKNLKVGDLVFFSTKATTKYSRKSIKRIGHVGIYAGKNRVLHTYGKGGVKVSNMASGWWDKHYVAAVRVR